MASVKEQVNSLEDKPKAHNEDVDKSKKVDTGSGSGSGSGSENGEKPVREKLKKADLEEANASIPNGIPIEGGSGKLKKKRSYEGLTNEEEVEHDTPSEGAHARKKTREATSPTKKVEKTFLKNSKAGSEDPEEVKHSDAESDKIIATPPSSGDEAMVGLTGTNMIKKKRSSEEMLGSQDEMAKSPKIAATDTERGRRSSSTPVSDRDYNSTTKLQKKRSSEEMLGLQEILRSQKVAATDAERGRRSSSAPPSEIELNGAYKLQKKRSSEEMLDSQDEISRSPKVTATEAERDRRSSSAPPSDNESNTRDSNLRGTTKAGPPKGVPQEEVALSKNTTSTIQATSGFGNASSISPFAALASKKTASLSSEQLPQTSSSAFAGSGFAALAGSNSPFGSVPKVKPASVDSSLLASTSAFVSSGFASLSGSTSPFGSSAVDSKPTSSLGASPFAASTSHSGFGGSSVFKSGFGGGNSGANKLSSFAAPVGDTKLGQTSAAKPFGAPEVEEDEDDEDGDDNSENEDGYEDDASSSVADPGAEVPSQFKIRNGKHSSNLYKRKLTVCRSDHWGRRRIDIILLSKR